MIQLKIFIAFLKISLFAFGGAYSFIPLIEREVVQNHKWLGRPEFLEVLGIARVFPGALSIKFATYTGYKVGGILGAIVANLGNIVPPALFILLIAHLYSKYKEIPAIEAGLTAVQYAIFAMIIAVAIQVVDKTGLLEFKYIAVIVASFALFMFTKVHPAFIITGAGLFGALVK